jgi:hypothetical protein
LKLLVIGGRETETGPNNPTFANGWQIWGTIEFKARQWPVYFFLLGPGTKSRRLRARLLIQMGVPVNWNSFRIWRVAQVWRVRSAAGAVLQT